MPKNLDKNNIIVALDIGTAKIAVLVAEIFPGNKLEIIGIASEPSSGLKKGIVNNIEAVVYSVKKAVEEAELISGCQIRSMYTNITGNHIKSLNSHGIVAIKYSEVTNTDLERVIEAAKALAIPAEQKILHVLPQEYIIDNQAGIHEPLAMTGVRLEGKVHVITGSISAGQNIVTCTRRLAIEVDDLVFSALASSYSVLTEDEKRLGVCLVDLGAGTSDIAVFVDNAILHTAAIPIAGDQVTNDIAIAFRTSTKIAEDLKLQAGHAYADLADAEQNIEIKHIGLKESSCITQLELAEVIEPRIEELFLFILAELKRLALYKKLNAGIVLTGGSAKMQGILELAAQIFNLPVRIGAPINIADIEDSINNPSFATATGLLLYGLEKQGMNLSTIRLANNGPAGGIKDFFAKMKNWFQGNF